MNQQELREEIKTILGAARETFGETDDQFTDDIIRLCRTALPPVKKWYGWIEMLFWSAVLSFSGVVVCVYYWGGDEQHGPHHLEWMGPLGWALLLLGCILAIKTFIYAFELNDRDVG